MQNKSKPGKSIDFASLLRTELRKRTKDDPAYSLRKFALQLEISPASLSRIMNRISEPSKDTIKKCERHFVLQKTDSDSDSTSRILPNSKKLRRRFMRTLKVSNPNIHLGRAHFAVIGLSKTDGFRNCEFFISGRLSLPPEEVRQIISDLKQLDVLHISRKGDWRIMPANLNVHFSLSSGIKSHLEGLEKNIEWYNSIKTADELQLSDGQCLTVAMNPARLPEIQEVIELAREQILAIAQRDKKRSEVYQISFHTIPSTVITPKP